MDSSFLMHIANNPLPNSNYLSEIQSYSLLTINDVINELLGISKDPKAKRSKQARLALNYVKNIVCENITKSGNTDDKLVFCAMQKHGIIASLDRDIIQKADKLSLDYVTIEHGRLIWNINYNK